MWDFAVYEAYLQLVFFDSVVSVSSLHTSANSIMCAFVVFLPK